MAQKFDLQSKFLDQLVKDKSLVTVYTANGVPIKCKVIAHDAFTLTLNARGKIQLLNKNGVSTITPV